MSAVVAEEGEGYQLRGAEGVVPVIGHSGRLFVSAAVD